jgi:hypothetical protein
VGPIITAVCVDAKHQVTVDYSSTLKLGDWALWIGDFLENFFIHFFFSFDFLFFSVNAFSLSVLLLNILEELNYLAFTCSSYLESHTGIWFRLHFQ